MTFIKMEGGKMVQNDHFKSPPADGKKNPQAAHQWSEASEDQVRMHIGQLGPNLNWPNFFRPLEEDGTFHADFQCPSENIDETDDEWAAQLQKFNDLNNKLRQVTEHIPQLRPLIMSAQYNGDVCKRLAIIKHYFSAMDPITICCSLRKVDEIAAWSEENDEGELGPARLVNDVKEILTDEVLEKATPGMQRLAALTKKLVGPNGPIYRECADEAFRSVERDPVNDPDDNLRFEAVEQALDIKYNSRKEIGNANEDEPNRVFNARGMTPQRKQELQEQAYYDEQREQAAAHYGGADWGGRPTKKGKGKDKGWQPRDGGYKPRKGNGKEQGGVRKGNDKDAKCKWCGQPHHVAKCWVNPYNPPHICKLNKQQKIKVKATGYYDKSKHGAYGK